MAFSPFHDTILATASTDTTLKIWNIPAEGIQADINDSEATLKGHHKKASQAS